MEILGLVENMSGYTCLHCGETVDIFGAGGGERTARSSNLAFLGRIPFDPEMVKCGDAGVPIQEKFADSAAARAFGAMVETISTLTSN